MKQGFIKLQREIQGTWIHKDPVLFKAWIDILFNVNWEEKKVFIGTTQYVCGVGESLYSLDTWANIFGGNWNKSKVRRFFKRLTDETIIDTQNERKTTRLKIVNIGVSDDSRHGDETQSDTEMKRKATPTKELRIKNKEVIESNLPESLKTLAEEYLKMRAKIGKKLKTSRAIKTKLNRLEKYVKEFGEQKTIECLNLTLDNEWQDIKMEWLEREQKNKGHSANCDNSQPLDLNAYLEPVYHPVELRKMHESGKYQEYVKILEENKFRLSNVAKSINNPTFSVLFLFEATFMNLGNRLGGSNDTRKMESLLRWAKTLTDYQRNKGDFRKLLQERNKALSL